MLYRICELYIDDLIIYASTMKEYEERLEMVFKRFEEYGITVNPNKCKFLMTEVEYVGYLLTKEGIEVSEGKRQKALDFPLPTTYKNLKQFVGLAEQFHRFIDKFYSFARPLHAILQGYNSLRNKSKPIPWTEENKKAFYDLQEAIEKSQKLYFVDGNKEIFLRTDASDYGIGAVLYQKSSTDESEIPIAFISKTLQKEQLRWSVPEKEAYAIFYALCKLEHLIRDVHFLMQTDHKNLTYINYGNSAKILRWKLHIQEFDFSLEHIAGSDNDVADAFSRLVENHNINILEKHELLTLPDYFIPDEMFDAIKLVHNSTVGHHGVERTIRKLQNAKQNWPYQREHVRMFIKKCPCCQKMSMLKIPIHTHPFVVGVYNIMGRVAIDTIGPLPKDESGNQYIITMVDCFSRYCLLSAQPDATAKSASKAILTWISLFGVMQQLLSDMGSQYVNHIIEEIIKHLGVQKLGTLPGIHEENSIVENRNKEVVRHLRAIVNHRKIKSQWSDVLPLVQRIINAEIIEGLNVSPAQILFGNSIDLDRGLFLTNLPDTGQEITTDMKATHLSEWMARMLRAQADIVTIAQETQHKNHTKHFQNFSTERTEFKIGDYVKINYGDNRPDSKLHTYWRGPYRVVNTDSINPNRIAVQNLVTGKIEDFPNGQLQPFEVDERHGTPLETAMMDEDYEIVEEIISHYPKKLHLIPKSKISFKVKYKGELEPRKVNYATLRDNIVLHNYLRSIKATTLIPSKYKQLGANKALNS